MVRVRVLLHTVRLVRLGANRSGGHAGSVNDHVFDGCILAATPTHHVFDGSCIFDKLGGDMYVNELWMCGTKVCVLLDVWR